MQVTRVTVSAARKVPHPTQDFANLSTLVSLEAQLQEGDDHMECLQRLQSQADAFVDAHTNHLLGRQNGATLHWKSQQATETRAAKLAEKHGARF